jgi:hypothetical protein
MLDCKVSGKVIEEVERYRERGWEIITSRALDRPTKQYDILATTFTQLSEKRLRNVGCRRVVVKDNDEPWNVIKPETVSALGVKIQLIEDWGIATRVAWNLAQVTRYAPDFKSIYIIANTPSHDALIARLTMSSDVAIDYGLKVQERKQRNHYDVVIVHMSKDDFTKGWLDPLLQSGFAQKLLISTTRGPLYSAKVLNVCVRNKTPEVAVLDWTWQEEELDPQLIRDRHIVMTRHTSYQSEESRRELTDVTIRAVEKMIQ